MDQYRRRVQQDTHGHRGRKEDPLYRARRSLHTGTDLLTDTQVDRLPNGLLIDLPRSKTNQRGTTNKIVVIPRGSVPCRCPVTTLQTWLNSAQISDGAVFRPVSKDNRALERRLTPAAINDLVQAATLRAGLVTEP